jgi:hypothetical protein
MMMIFYSMPATGGIPCDMDLALRESSVVCVFITAGPSTKLFACGGVGIWEDMCYERRRAEACVD